MWQPEIFQYPATSRFYTRPTLPWFAGMWHVDSHCEYSYIFDPKSGVLYEYGSRDPERLPPIRWTRPLRRNILLLVCPD